MLFEHLCKSASRNPDRLAAVDPSGAVTFAQLRAMSAAVGRRIVQLSPESADPVAILLPTSVGFAVAFYAVQSAGRTALPLNFMLAPAELAAVLADSGAKMVLSSRQMESFLTSFSRDTKSRQSRDAGERVPPEVFFLEDLLADLPTDPGDRPAPPANSNQPAALLYTSGSTGQPKGVMLSATNLLADALGCIQMAEMEPEERFFGALPLFHAFGLTALLVVPNMLGTTAYYQPRFNPRQALATIAEHRVTVMMAIPSIYAAMLKACHASRLAATRSPAGAQGSASAPVTSQAALPHLRLPICGGEPLAATLAEQFERTFARPLLEGYGLTEASPVVSLNLPGASRPGTVGRPLPNITLRILDETGQTCPPGQPGEVVVAGPTVMLGYRGRPVETAAVLTPDGSLRTGDLGVLDGDGFLRIAGRIKDMVIVGGENVYPGEVERVLSSHPKVARVACVGVPDAARGQAIAAFIQPGDSNDPPDQADLRAFCRDRLAGYKVPRQFTVMPELPVGPTGKVLKGKLGQF